MGTVVESGAYNYKVRVLIRQMDNFVHLVRPSLPFQ
jgi:hypothetical protein